jgi:hypothetical protein
MLMVGRLETAINHLLVQHLLTTHHPYENQTWVLPLHYWSYRQPLRAGHYIHCSGPVAHCIINTSTGKITVCQEFGRSREEYTPHVVPWVLDSFHLAVGRWLRHQATYRPKIKDTTLVATSCRHDKIHINFPGSNKIISFNYMIITLVNI